MLKAKLIFRFAYSLFILFLKLKLNSWRICLKMGVKVLPVLWNRHFESLVMRLDGSGMFGQCSVK